MADQISGLLSPFLRYMRIEAVKPWLYGRVLDYGCGVGILARYIDHDKYVGVDIDDSSIRIAARSFPHHSFMSVPDFSYDLQQHFDTIACLAIVEHAPSPAVMLTKLMPLLSESGRLVLTTPNPRFDWAHGIGAQMRLFSPEGHEQHQSLMDRAAIFSLAEEMGVDVKLYRKFLLGANQLVVLTPNKSAAPGSC